MLDMNESLSLTESTMKLATLSGLDFEEATQAMTAAIRGFSLEMSEGDRVLDVYSQLAAVAAVDVEQLSTAMSKTASIANSAGAELETTSAFLTQIIEVTQEAATTSGDALKTIIARYTELKENVAGTDESEFEDLNFNDVDEALKSIGISLKDANGQFKDFDDVILELASRWDSLDRNTQRYIATVSAGSRQQSRFLALMSDYDRLTELIDEAYDSEGKSAIQFAKYQDTVEYKLTQLKNTWEQLRVSFADSDFYEGVIEFANNFLTKINDFDVSDFAILIATFTSVGKIAFNSLLNGFKQASIAGSKLFQEAGKSISDKLNKVWDKSPANLKISVDEASAQFEKAKENLSQYSDSLGITVKSSLNQKDITALESVLESSQTQLDNFNNNFAQTTINIKQNMQEIADAFSIETDGLSIEDFNVPEADSTGYVEQYQALQDELANVTSEGQNKQAQILKTNDALGEYLSTAETKKKAEQAQLQGQTIGAVLATGITTSITAIITSNDVGGSVLAVIGTMMLQYLPILISTAAGIGGSIGTALSEAFVATGGVPALVLTAIVAAITAIGVAAKNAYEKAQLEKPAARIAELKSELEDLEQTISDTQSTIDETNDEIDTLDDIKNTYEELKGKIVLTEDEQETYNSMIETLQSEYPELISYYNEETGQLQLQNTLLDQKLEKLQQAKQEEAEALLTQETQSIALNTQQERLQAINDLGSKFGTNSFDEDQISSIVSGENTELAIKHSQRSESVEWTVGIDVGGKTIQEDELADFWNENELGKKVNHNIFTSDFGDENYATIQAIFDYAINQSEDNTEKLNEVIASTSEEYGENISIAAETLKSYVDQTRQALDESSNNFAEYFASVQAYLTEIDPDIEQGELILRSGTAAQFADVAEESTGDLIEKIDSNNEFKNLTDDIFNDWIEDLEISEAQEAQAKAVVKGSAETFKDIFGAVTDNAWGTKNNYSKVKNDLDAKSEEIFDILYPDADAYDAVFKGLSDDEAAEELAEDLINYYISQIDEAIGEAGFSEDLESKVNTLIKNQGSYTSQQYQAQRQVIVEQYAEEQGIDYDVAKAKVDEIFADVEQSYTEAEQNLANYGIVAQGITQDTMVQLSNIASSTAETLGNDEQLTSEAMNNILATVESSNLSSDLQNAILSFDPSSLDDSTYQSAIDTITELMSNEDLEGALGEQEARAFAVAYIEALKNSGLADFSIITIMGLEEVGDEIQEELDTITSGFSNLTDYISDQITNGYINATDISEIEEQLEEMSDELDINDYLGLDDEGNYTLDYGQLYEDTQGLIANQDVLVEQAKQQVEEGIEKLEIEQSALETIYNQIKGNEALTGTIYDQIKAEGALQKLLGADVSAILEGTGISIDENGSITGDYSDNTAVLDALNVQIESTENQIADLEEQLNSIDESILPQSSAWANEIYQNMQEIIDGLEEDMDDAKENMDDALEEEKDALEALQDAQDDVIEKQKELNEALYGSDDWEASIDDMYNYTTNLERLKEKADEAKETLEDLQDWDNASEAMDEYIKNVREELATGDAAIEVYQQAITSGQKSLNEDLAAAIAQINSERGTNISADLSNLYTLVGDRYNIDLEKINSLEIPDEFKDRIIEEIESWNTNLDEIEEIQDEKIARQKEFNELYKTGLQGMVDLEEEMMNTLKEKYQDEIDDLENKYSAMEEADNDYLDALEDAIQKQRDLREQEDSWRDLADKERKLSLMQRDTSGGNRADVRSLEQEVEDDREQLLDDTVDNIIDGLREMYELQQESREAEITYRETLLDEGLLMQEVTAALSNINSAEDLVAWFYENTADVSSMSAEQLELEKLQWEELYSDKLLYLETSQTDFNEALKYTAEDVKTIVMGTSETLTTNAQEQLDDVTTTVNEDIKEAQDALQDALDNLAEKQKAYSEAVEASTEALKLYTEAQKAWEEAATSIRNNFSNDSSNSDTSLNYGTKTINKNTTAGWQEYNSLVSTAETANSKGQSYETWASGHLQYDESTLTDAWNAATSTQASSSVNSINNEEDQKNKVLNSLSSNYAKFLEEGTSLARNGYAIIKEGDYEAADKIIKAFKKYKEDSDFKNTLNDIFEKTGYSLYYNKDYNSYLLTSSDDYATYVPTGSSATYKKLTKYANGGLVNYTGPAWVDGTPSSPEAFLSSEDTKRIGEAAKLLSNIDFLTDDKTISQDTITNQNVGDTTIEIHINIENVSSDYDVDQAVERVKEDIVNAAKYTGSNVILKK